MPFAFVPVTINRYLGHDPSGLYRLRFDWHANGGLSTYPDSDQYVYITDNPLERSPAVGGVEERVAGAQLPVCGGIIGSRPEPYSPFSLIPGEGLMCFSTATPRVQGGLIDYGPLQPGRVGAVAEVFFPMLIAAIDPEEEQKLLDLSGTITSGRMLAETDRPRIERKSRPGAPSLTRYQVVPFIASRKTYVDESLTVTVERLDAPSKNVPGRLASSTDAYHYLASLRGRVVGSLRMPIGTMYRRLLATMMGPTRNLEISYEALYTASAPRYRIGSSNTLFPQTRNNATQFISGHYGSGWAPLEDKDVQFRGLTRHPGSMGFSGSVLDEPAIQIIGQFDPELLPGFSPLSEVPLETYYPPKVVAVDGSSSQALRGEPLLPTMNVGGYVSQPPLMLTTLKGLKAFADAEHFADVNQEAPISVVRVRVAGVTGADPLSRERIRRAAELIHDRTGLAVDITAGSSPTELNVQLPAGKFGQSPLLVQEGWTEKGVAIRFLNAVDAKSLALFILILVVCVFFLANASFAAVQTRRSEIGTLSCLGWSKGAIFRFVLGELILIGAAAGLAGTAVALVVIRLLKLHMSLSGAFLVIPIAVAISLIAGFMPALHASRAVPLDAIRPSVDARSARRRVRTVASMGLANARRRPSRTALGAVGLLVAVAALTFLFAINLAFQGVLFGTLLGGAISVQVRGIDLLSVGLAIALAGFSVADVLLQNARERAPKLATLKAAGWADRNLSAAVSWEGLTIGMLGVLPGAVLGLALATFIGGFRVEILEAASVAAAVGVAVTLVALIVPAARVGRLSPASVLAEEA